MLRNRTFLVRMVKDSDIQEVPRPRDEIHPAAHISVLMENAVVGGVVLIGAYFAADTIRSCIIHTAMMKIQPSVLMEVTSKK